MNFLDRLDNYYYSKKPSEAWIMIILVALLIGYLLYNLISDISYDYKERQKSKNVKLHNNIDLANSYLDSITINGDKNYTIKELNKKIINKKSELNTNRAKLSKLDGASRKLTSVLYNNVNWSIFLHNITTKAEDNNLKLYNIENRVYDQNDSFGKVMDVYIKCKGEFGEILSFVNDLERTKLVANVSMLKLKSSSNNPIADINFTVWGIKQ